MLKRNQVKIVIKILVSLFLKLFLKKIIYYPFIKKNIRIIQLLKQDITICNLNQLNKQKKKKKTISLTAVVKFAEFPYFSLFLYLCRLWSIVHLNNYIKRQRRTVIILKQLCNATFVTFCSIAQILSGKYLRT